MYKKTADPEFAGQLFIPIENKINKVEESLLPEGIFIHHGAIPVWIAEGYPWDQLVDYIG